jgi:hypothetical protein
LEDRNNDFELGFWQNDFETGYRQTEFELGYPQDFPPPVTAAAKDLCHNVLTSSFSLIALSFFNV